MRIENDNGFQEDDLPFKNKFILEAYTRNAAEGLSPIAKTGNKLNESIVHESLRYTKKSGHQMS